MPARVVDKVTAFVTRGEGPARELLLFHHPNAGVQLPAGTVEIGEPLEDAVLREVWEETGLREVEIAACLDSATEFFEGDGRMVCTPVPLLSEPCDDGSCLPVHLGGGLMISRLTRGLTVRPIPDDSGAFTREGLARVGYDLFEIRSSHDWVLVETFTGWIPEEALAVEVRRHLFHLRLTAPTPDRWTHDGDVPGCVLFWAPLTEDPGLVRGQDAWLERVWDRLKKG